jgi:ribosome biogenesis GTPase A
MGEQARTQAPIQHFPGHMAAAMRKLAERLALADVVVEVRDARLPEMSANSDLDRLAGTLPRLVVLGREDLADGPTTRRWLAWYAAAGRHAVAVDGRSQPGVNDARAALEELLRGRGPSRAIVVGIPNTGKSALINGLARRTVARTENKAGVTRQLRWLRMSPALEIMDTPGILVPKIASPTAQWMLALTGAVPRTRYDPEEIAGIFAGWAAEHVPRAQIPELEAFARARGFVRRGDVLDLHNAAGAFVKAFNAGALGRFSFEAPPETVAG